MGEEQPSGADIETAVSYILSPFKRMYSSAKAHIGKDNGSFSDGLDEQCSSSDAQLVENAEFEGTSTTDLSLRLLLTDDRVMNFKPFKKDALFESGKITLDNCWRANLVKWSLLGLYIKS